MKVFGINPVVQNPSFSGRPKKVQPEIVKQYVESGLSFNEIAEKLDVTYNHILKVYNEIVRQTRLSAVESYKPQIQDMINQKYSVDEIAKNLNMHGIEVEELLRYFAKRVFHSEKHNCRNAMDERFRIGGLLRQGDSRVQIAEIYGVSSAKVSNWLKEFAYETPKDKPSPSKDEVLKVLEEERNLYRPVGKVFNFGSKLGISNASFEYLIEKYNLNELYWRIKYNV